MNDRPRSLDLRGSSDDDLGALLRESFAFPAAPDVAPGVLDRLDGTAGRGAWWRWPRLSRSAALAIVALLVVAAIAAAAILGVSGIRIVPVDELDRSAPAVSAPVPDVGRLSASLGLGVAMSLSEVRERVAMPVATPDDPALGPPDAVYLDRGLAGGMVSMVWAARPGLPASDQTGVGLLISQFDGQVNRDGFRKLVDQGVRVDQVTVAGEQAWWLHGATHLFLRRAGSLEESHPVVPTRLASDTLLWERGGLTFRLEGRVSLARAVEIAASISGNASDADGVVPS